MQSSSSDSNSNSNSNGGMRRRMIWKQILKDKKTWYAAFLVCWAAALQANIMWVQKQDAFIQKFGTDDQKQALNAKSTAMKDPQEEQEETTTTTT